VFVTSADLREVLFTLSALELSVNLADALVETLRETSVAISAELLPIFLLPAAVADLRDISVP
jgi:hypothetical protein